MKRKEIKSYIESMYGKVNDREYTSEDMENIAGYFRKNKESYEAGWYVDDITWHDVNMDMVFKQINNTNSSVGEEYLYNMLRKTDTSVDELRERDKVLGYMKDNPKERTELAADIYKVGYAYKISLSDYIENLIKAPKTGTFIHFAAFLSLVIAVLFAIFFDAALGILLVIAALVFDISSYYKAKNEVSPYFTCLRYIIKMNKCAKSIIKRDIKDLEKYNTELKNAVNDIEPILKGSFWVSDSRNINGSPAEVLLDYLRMLTHVDLIIFNKIVGKVSSKKEQVYTLYETIGFLEAMIAVSSYREMLPYFSRPEFVEEKILDIKDAYHPLISEPVSNSIKTDKCVLITGSNASGKSTFLKTIAINAILAQSIYTTTANSYKAARFSIFSSMALSDNLSGGESYYMVEIKSLKRILNAGAMQGLPVLFFIDEVLRGTNTIERIAASSQILRTLSGENTLGFAATHDIELTNILEKYYVNYHFREDVGNEDITFNYVLHSGAATTRNAIKLLKIIGYDDDIISSADNMAETFVKTNDWIRLS